MEKYAIPIPREAPALSSSQSSLQPFLDSRLLCREDHSSPILNLGHLLPAPSCHTALLRLKCAVMKPRLHGDSSVPCRGASLQQREGGSLQLSHQDTSNGTVVPRAPGCGTRLREKAGHGCPPPQGPAAHDWDQPSSLDAFPHGPCAGSCPPGCLGPFQKICSENVTTGVPGETRALIQACK